MKKLIVFLFLITGFIGFAQGTIPVYPNLKLTKLPAGNKQDSVVVITANKTLKQLPTSAIKGTTNLDYLATPTGGTVFSSTGNDAVLPLVDGTNAGLMHPASKTKLDGIEYGAQVNVPTNLDKIASPGGVTILSSTGNSTVIPLVDATNAGLISSGKILKLDGIASGATANQTDAYLLDRANHTGVQDISTVTGLQTALDSKVDKVAGERLINASEITKLSNQSGTNTGDQDLSGLATITALNNKVDKVTGKSLLSDAEIARLATLENYTHPANHPPSIITQDASNRFVTDAEKAAWNAKQSALGYTAENSANKNTADGYAGLGWDGKLISSQLPSITISDTFVTASQAAMLALIAETGDVAVRTDLNKSFILKGTNPTVLADWQELLTPTSAVTTVFGRNGAVTAQTGDYTASMVGAPAGSGTSTGTNTGDNATNTQYSSLVTNATHTGDASGSTVLTLATVNSNVGTFGTASNVAQSTVNAKGLTTAIANVPIQITESQVTSLVSDLAGKEASIGTKNTAFNKNFGTTAGTVAEGNDSRILNGQTAYAWGNHAGLYPTYNGTGATGTWPINISGNSSSTINWGGFQGDFNSVASSFDYLTARDLGAGTIKLASLAGVKDWLGLGSNAYTSVPLDNILSNDGTTFISKYNSISDGYSRSGTIYNAFDQPLGTGLYNVFMTKWSAAYGSILAINTEPGTGDIYTKTLYSGTWGSWKTFLNSGNFNAYSPTLTGSGASGNWTINISGNSGTANAFANFSNGLSGGPFSGAPSSIVGIGGSSDMQRFNSSAVQSFLGLGSNAYTSTSYVPAESYNSINTWSSVSGFYGSYGSSAGMPNGANYWSGIRAVLPVDTTFGFDLINSHDGEDFYLRNRSSGGFGTWRQIYHSGNFNPANYLPLTGGTVTGELESMYRFKTPGMLMGYWDGLNNRIEGSSRPILMTSYGYDIKFGFNGEGNTLILKQSTGEVNIPYLSGTGNRTLSAHSDGTVFASTMNNADQISLFSVSGNADYPIILSGNNGVYNQLNYAGITYNPSTNRLNNLGPVKLRNYTVSTLPTGQQGDTAYVTDATAPTYLGTLTGGGSVKCPVFYNGSAWVSH